MFSREESAKMRQEFWTSFGKSFPRKWILYQTKIKGLSFKFNFDTKKAMVLMEIEGSLEHRIKYFEKMQSLQDILERDFLPNVVSCIFVEKKGVCIHNRETWQKAMLFLNENMIKMEDFWGEYEDFFRMEN